MINKIVGTVCSANHLAYAKTMAKSFQQFNPDYSIIICLVDKIDNRFNTTDFEPYTIIEVEQLAIPQFAKMSAQYSIIELNCAVKPYLCQFIYKNYHPDILLYLDSDIVFHNSIRIVEDYLLKSDIVITPHSFTPIHDNLLPMERDFLRGGLYNAGFIGMKNSSTANDFLNWWADKVIDQCYVNFAEGMCYDQQWLSLLPLYYQSVGIIQHRGFNVAYWNLHERIVDKTNAIYTINKKEPLIFMHISGYKFQNPYSLSVHQNRFNLKELPVVSEILEDYRKKVMDNGYEQFIHLKCFYAKPKKKTTGIMPLINKILSILGVKISKV